VNNRYGGWHAALLNNGRIGRTLPNITRNGEVLAPYRGQGPQSFKVGRKVLYDAAGVEEWLSAQQNAQAAGQRAG
jgi:hypothetical protein